MTLIRAIAFLLHFTIVPIAVGRLISYRVNNPEHRNAIATYVVGLFGSLGLFFLMCCGFTWHQNFTMRSYVITGNFSKLCTSYSIVIIILCVLWFFIDFTQIKNFKALAMDRLSGMIDALKTDKFCLVYAGMFLVLLVAQLYFAFAYEVNEWSYDDFDYVVNSADALYYDEIANVSVTTGETPFTEPKRAATSWPTYIAYLAEISHFEVATVCHTILPVVLILIAYGVFWLLSKSIFDKLDNRLIFMTILSVVFIFGVYSHYSLTFRLLCTIWQGKAVLCAIVIPFMFYYLPLLFKDEIDKYNMLPIFALLLGACSLTTMAVLLLTASLILMWITMCIYNRRIKGIRYVIAGLLAPAVQIIYYMLISMLLIEQQSPGLIWFGTNL